MRGLAAIVLCIYVCWTSRDVRGKTVEIVAGRDNAIFEENDNSGGAAITFAAGATNNGRARRGMLWFDVATHVEPGSLITGATLVLRMDGTSDTQPRDIRVHRLLADWGEGTSGGGGMGGGAGQPPSLNDATWNFRFFSTISWANPGGDFVAAPSAITAVGTAVDFYAWSSAVLAADVQLWLDHPDVNFGWIILGDESTSQTSRRFSTRDAPNATFRPLLVIEYTPVAEPATIWLYLAGSAFAPCVRRRSGFALN